MSPRTRIMQNHRSNSSRVCRPRVYGLEDRTVPSLTDGLIGYWPFEGNGNDLSSAGRHLTVYGNPEFPSGVLGQGLSLPNNLAQYAKRPVDDAAYDFGSGDFTIQLWVFPNESGEQTLLQKQAGWSVYRYSGRLGFIYGSNNVEADSKLQTWNHLVIRRSGTTASMFIDGVNKAGTSAASAIPDSTSPLFVGPANSNLDEFAIWNRALTDAEIGILYNGGLGYSALAPTPLIVSGSNPATGSVVTVPLTSFAIDFYDALDASTVQASDFTVNDVPANTVTLIDSDTAVFSFNTSPLIPGVQQTMQMAAGAVQSKTGQPLWAWNSTFEYWVPTTYVVTNVDDSGPGSFRDAVASANAWLGPNTITFDPVVFAAAATISLATGQLKISESVTVVGPGADKLTITANNNSRVLRIDAAPVSISGFTITGGKDENPGYNGVADDYGGGVLISNGLNSPMVTLTDCVITGNTADHGGGIGSVGAPSISLVRCVVRNNSGLGGGGIFAGGFWTLVDCTIETNTAGNGAGLYFRWGNLDFVNSTVSGNSTSGNGGGVVQYRDGAMTLTNCTISGNSAAGAGGGLFLQSVSIGPIVRNCTFTGNMAAARGGGIADYDSDNVADPRAVAWQMDSTIVAGNLGANIPDISFHGTKNTVTGNRNLIGVANVGNVTLVGTDNLTGTLTVSLNPMLAPLADNGGPTLTCALLSDSPAIDAGSNPGNLVNDQRGAGFPRVGGKAADIGAFEITGAPKVGHVVINGGAQQRSRVTTLSIDFDQVVTLPAIPTDAIQLKRIDDSLPVEMIVAVNNDTTTHVSLTFTGALAEFGSLADGNYQLTVLAAQVSNTNGQLDGNGDGIPGDNYTFNFHRLFGDSNGDRTVNVADFGAFRTAFFSGGPSVFDFNNDGLTNAVDFAQFRVRFGIMLPP